MRIMPNYRTVSWLVCLAAVLLLPDTLWGQTTPQDQDDVWAFGNAPYSNPLPAEHAPLTPFAPVGFKHYWKWFAPVDISDYGNGIKPRRGFFFSYERMLMSTSRPAPSGIGANNATEGDTLNFLNVITSPITAPVTSPQQIVQGGSPGSFSSGGGASTTINAPASSYAGAGLFPTATVTNPAFPGAQPITPTFFQAGSEQIEVPFALLTQGTNLVGQNSNSASTGILTSRFGTGNRWEFGYMDTDDYGWLVSILDHINSGQNVSLPGGTVLFNDPLGLLQGYQTGAGGNFDADLNGNHIFGRNGYTLPTQTITPGTTTASLPPVIIPAITTLTYPTSPNSPAPLDFGIYFPQLTLNGLKGVPNGTTGTGVITYQGAGGDEVVFTPSFTRLVIANKATTTGVEVMRMYRPPQLHNGGEIDFIWGARYLQFNDVFQVYGFGGPFDAMSVTQKVLNNVVGPQIGARYNKQRGRWAFWTEGRFFPSANFAVERNVSTLASNTPPATLASSVANQQIQVSSGSGSSGSTTSIQGPAVVNRDAPTSLINGGLSSSAGLNNMQFSPAVEFRAGFNCWLTQGVAVKSSYTGIFLPNMTRASDSIDYSLPTIGILNGGHHQCVMLNGFTLGIEINR
jgi:hypothetical protein